MTETEYADGWIPVALFGGFGAGSVMRVESGGRDVAVWRGHDGKARAFDDRCPHRGMSLSHGFVRENRLSCLYHGWQYDGGGACRYIPAHPDLEPPKTICATTFQCREFDGVVWLSTRDAPFPLSKEFGGSDLRSLAVNCAPEQIRAMLRNAVLPAADGSAGAIRCQTLHDDGSRIALTAVEGKGKALTGLLVFGLQPLASKRTMLHVQCEKAADAMSKKRLSRWTERVRQFAENPGIGSQSWRPFEEPEIA